MNYIAFWEVILCSLLGVGEYFGEMYHLHLQCQSKMSKEAESKVLCFLFNHINGGIMFL